MTQKEGKKREREPMKSISQCYKVHTFYISQKLVDTGSLTINLFFLATLVQ